MAEIRTQFSVTRVASKIGGGARKLFSINQSSFWRAWTSVGKMGGSPTCRLLCHGVALFIEAVGTLFIYLDTCRLNARLPSEPLGVLATFGDPVPYRAWYYHRASLGFALLFIGIIVAGFVLWLEHSAHVARSQPSNHEKGVCP